MYALPICTNRLSFFAFAAVLIGMFGFAIEATHATDGTNKKPNIVFVLTDDQGYGDLSAHGNPVLATPHLDQLRSDSFRFLDFHVSPTCAPTRSALLTGRHEFKNGVTHTILERERLTLDAITLPQMLQGAGYATGIFGKWHLGDEDEYLPGRRGFDEVFIHGAGGIGQSYPGSCGDVPGNSYFDPIVLHNDQLKQTKGYCTDVFFERASTWLAEQAASEKPFFAYISTNAPHSPYHAKKEDAAVYRDKVANEDLANFYGMIHNIDENVGRLRSHLQRLGIEKDTLIVFMNDNGTAVGHTVFSAGMRGAKGSPWLGGTRAISFWCWPEMIPTGETSELTSHIDFLSTIAELAGIPLPQQLLQQIEGRSLVPLWQTPSPKWPDRFLVTHVGRWPKHANPDEYRYSNVAIRNTRWAMVNPNGAPLQDGTVPAWQLFDLQEDYAQTKNVAVEHPEIVQEMQVAYDRWWGECRSQLVNEHVVGPKLNPFAVRYWRQFGGEPTEEDYRRMDPDQGWPPRR
ncbi:arylsulfatase [Pirellulaceae bacterium SH449]